MEKKQRNHSLKKQALTVIIILSFWCTLRALDPDKSVDQYLVEQWQKSEGLPSNTIISIEQTPDSYLWIASSRGLSRFDGIKFSTRSYLEKEKITKHHWAFRNDLTLVDLFSLSRNYIIQCEDNTYH